MKVEETNNDNLERQLREAAEDFQLQPSAKVWEGIQSEIRPNRRRYVFWWLAAAALVLMGLGTWFILQQKAPEARQPDLTQKSENKIQQTEGSIRPSSPKNTEKTLAITKGQPTGTKPGSEKAATKKYQQKIPGKKIASTRLLSDKKTDDQSNADFLPFLENIQPVFEPLKNPEATGLAFSNKIKHAEKNKNNLEQAKQDLNQSPAKKEKKLSWQFYFTPGVSYRNFTLNKTKTSSQDLSSTSNSPMQGNNPNSTIAARRPSPKKIEHRKDWGWEAGVRASLNLEKDWIVQTGLSVARLGYSIHAFGSYPVYVSNSGNASITNAAGANSYYTSYFLNATAAAAPAPSATFLQNRYLMAELPLLVGKQFGEPGKTNFVVLAGPGLAYLLGSSSIIYAPGPGRYFTNKDYLKPLNLNIRLEASFHIHLNKYLQITVGPSFQYQLLSTYKDYPQVKEHPYLIGIKTGIQLGK